MRRRWFRIACVIVALAAGAGTSRATSTGIVGRSGKQAITCNGCHGGGVVPSVTFDGPTTLAPGTTGTFTFTVHSNDADVQLRAGFNVAASGGTLRIVTGQPEKVLSGELTHTAPQPVADLTGDVTWTFRWQAPARAGDHMFWGAGNSVNFDHSTSGDRVATTTYGIVVGAAAASPTASPTDGPPSPSPSPTAVASATATQTSTPTVTPPLSPTPTATSLPTQAPSATGSATATPTATASPSAPPLPTVTPTETIEPTSTATASGTATATSSVTPMPSVTVTPTPSPIPTAAPSLAGDANCDSRVTAGDLPALVVALVANDIGLCGADADRNDHVDDADVRLTITALFTPPD